MPKHLDDFLTDSQVEWATRFEARKETSGLNPTAALIIAAEGVLAALAVPETVKTVVYNWITENAFSSIPNFVLTWLVNSFLLGGALVNSLKAARNIVSSKDLARMQ